MPLTLWTTTSTLATASSTNADTSLANATCMVVTGLSRTNANGRGNVSTLKGEQCQRQHRCSHQRRFHRRSSPTLDHDDDEDIAEEAPIPAQPLLPARRPRVAPEPTVHQRHFRLLFKQLLIHLLRLLLFQQLSMLVSATCILSNRGSLFRIYNLTCHLQHYLHRPVHWRPYHQLLLLQLPRQGQEATARR